MLNSITGQFIQCLDYGIEPRKITNFLQDVAGNPLTVLKYKPLFDYIDNKETRS